MKKFFGNIQRILSSRVLLLWVIGGWISGYILAAIWTDEAFAMLVRELPERRLLQGGYLLSLAVGFLNLIRSFRERFKEGWGTALSRAILPAGILLFGAGFLISLHFRQFETMLVGLGNEIRPSWESELLTVAAVEPGLKDGWIELNGENWLFEHEPRLTLAGSDSVGLTVPTFPPAHIGSTDYHILNFGLAPEARITYRGDTRIEGLVALKLLAFGAADDFRRPPYPFRFLISLHPNQIIRKGDLVLGHFVPEKPYYRIRIYDGDEMVAEGDSNGPTDFGDFSFTFGRTSFWVQLEMVQDPAVGVLRLGLWLFLIGIPVELGRVLVSAVRSVF